MKRRQLIAASAVATIIAIGICGCQGTADTPEQTSDGRSKITLALNWFPEPEHGGFYAAALNGHFRDEGLEVEILPGGPNAPVIEKLVRGQVQFGVSNADQVLIKRKQDADVVCLMAPLQSTPRCIMVHYESGITSFQNLANVKLAMSPGRAFGEYMKRHAPLNGVRIVPYSGRIAAFVADKQYAQQAYVFSEPILARRAGANVHALMISDLGYDPYTSCIVADASLIKNQPDLVRRFVRACQRGWQDYLDDPTVVNAELLKLNEELDEDSLEQAHKALLPLCEQPAGQPFGAMSKERWQTLKNQLVEIDFVPQAMDVQQAFDNQFVASESAQ